MKSFFLQDRAGDVEVRFYGRTDDFSEDRAAALRALAPEDREAAWLRQIHSAEVLVAAPGCAGEGDALVSENHELALAVVTADCVPVLFAGRGELAAAHAGWRGLAAGVLPATLRRLHTPRADLVAWIGPSIGPCCYEVSDEVAEQIAAASTSEAVVPGRGERPHLDLVLAAERQLRDGGVDEIRRLAPCTRCDERWWSYRRDGREAGRNVAIVFRD